ncbi:phosphoribosylformylglycinamidine synthase, purS protein [Pajaroellobacter abortibovis]|uniref:Phosphoribosylformylglycinamidine synthase subunit PurS n=1 Tax=Pajaroellobacter abortibovis TaxID=1882918 RepID=A0A1L6MV69_9BACT|nr:phosphoribosylformylglycinamidine synthase, purS protein [Pajaroellobacter abortibovis]
MLDPQGDAVGRMLEKLGFQEVKRVRVGKLIELDLDAHRTQDREYLLARLIQMADGLLANPVMETYEIQVEDSGSMDGGIGGAPKA